ncbi:hypothetical protein [Companilactobacillus zhongbaensis]|uniref:hypothetical protein n=1 Tax=Companilactobacillus zhongbaensis TaxID=2486009 RepID=UPI0013DE3BFC|nr:hypothetical protein [Companilactobacillus zhongbaensis]
MVSNKIPEKEGDQMSKPEFDISKLTPKAQAKLEEIRKKQNFKTLEEAANYMRDFTNRK